MTWQKSQALADSLKGVEFTVVQASYLSPVTAKADVVLPSLLWTESKGNYTTLDGIRNPPHRWLKRSGDIKTDADTLERSCQASEKITPVRSEQMAKVKVATVWLESCAGCHMSFLDIDEFIIDLSKLVEFRRSPITDIKGFDRC